MTSTFFINGRRIISDGSLGSISIVNGKVLVGGRQLDLGKPGENGAYTLVVENGGRIERLDCDCDVSVTGDVQGSVSAGSSVTCKNVGGQVSAGSSVSCGDVDSNVSAGSSVRCGNVKGRVSAGSSVHHT